MMSRLGLVGIVMYGLMGVTSSALAGASHPNPLVITASYARGSMRSVRESNDSYESIGCYSSGPSRYVRCVARNRTQSLTCFENRPEVVNGLMQTLAAMTSDSALCFRVGPDGRCRQVRVENFSYWR